MLDGVARRLIDPPLTAVARRLHRLGVSATAVTVVGFLIGIAGCGAIATGEFLLALGLIAANRIADGLDGAIAREAGPTDLGGYLDIVLDLIFYSAVPFAFAVFDPANALVSAFLIFSFIGTGGSFLAFAVIAEKRGRTTERSGRKSFFYSLGLMEGTETIAFFFAFCLWPAHYSTLAWIFGGLCWLTTLLRITAATREFRDRPRHEWRVESGEW
jgi:phosphatidylglycerophosphate synthase